MSRDKSEILQGTLDLMVLQTLETMGSMHGYGIGLAQSPQGLNGFQLQ